MGYHNLFAREQLVEVAKELTGELVKIKDDPTDDDYDKEHKRALKAGLVFSVEVINKRIKMLENEK